VAGKYNETGFHNVKVLDGGIEGWKNAGYRIDNTPTISVDFPFESKFVTVNGSKIHYVEQGEGQTFIFLHGNPTSSYLWRNIIPEISQHGRCIAPDLIGFGKSDNPDIGYTFLEHYDYIKGFITALGLKDIIFVIHDWGGPLGFYYAMNHRNNVKGIAFMETFAFTFRWDDFPKEFRMGFKLFRAPIIGQVIIMVLNVFVNQLIPNSIHRKLSKEIHDNYKKPFPTINSRFPVYVFPNEIPIEGRENETFKTIKELEKAFPQFEMPMILFTSTPGAIVTEKVKRWYTDNAKDLTVKDIGSGIHFLQEDNPEAIAQGIIDWATKKKLF
jgi:haloalkane dehalogenase